MATKSKFHTQDGIKTLGNAEIDGSLTVTGNFTVNGTQTIIDSTTSSITDSMIELASGNTTSDTLDVGIYGNYNDGLSGEGDVSEYTGLFRDASDSTWKLYDGLEVEPTTTVNTSGSGFTLADLQVGDLTATTLTATNSITGASIAYPTTDGTNGQAIITDGSGGLSFGTIDASTDGIITSGVTTIIQSQDDTNVIHVNNSAQVGIGTASPATNLHVYHPSSHSEIRVGTGGSSDAKVPAVSFNNTVVEWGIGVKADNHLHIRENTASYASRVTIADGGNVGIGTQAPSALLDVAYGDYQNSGALRIGADIGTNTSRTNSTRKIGVISAPHYTNAEDDISLLMIDSEDNNCLLSIGGTASAMNSPSSIAFVTSAAAAGTSTGSEQWRINASGHFTPSQQHAKDIGGVNAEVRNIYAQGLYIGGSGAANQLDDYEEGTWTPVTGPATTTATYVYRAGYYTKVGRMVTAYFGLKHTGGVWTGGEATIGGLPFAVHTTGSYQEPQFTIYTVGLCPTGITGAVGASNSLIPGQVSFYLSGGESQGRGRKFTANADTVMYGNEVFATNSFIKGTVTYFTA